MTQPTLIITSDRSALNASQTANITFTFSTVPSGFTLGDVNVTGGTLSAMANQGGGVYTAIFTPNGGVDGGTAVISVADNTYTDGFAGSGLGATCAPITYDTYAAAPSTPVLDSLYDSGPSNTDGVTNSPILKFSGTAEAGSTVTLFDSDGVTALGSTTAVGGAWSITTGFMASGTHTVTAQIRDAAGNVSPVSAGVPITIDTLAPTSSGASISFSADTGASNSDLVTNVAAQVISGTLDAPVGPGEVTQVSLDNGLTWANAVATGPTSWSLPLQSLTGSNTLQVRVADQAGNTGPVMSAAYILDQNSPQVAITSSASTLKAGETATITVTFSEPPDGFTLSDLSSVNATLGGFSATANPLVYTAVLTPDAMANGSVNVTLAGGSYKDLAGNLGIGASGPVIAVDTVAPSAVISSNVATAGSAGAVITFTFSEPPVGFTSNSVTVTNGTLGPITATDPYSYIALFTPTLGMPAGSASISVSGYTDAAGNPGAGATLPALQIDTVAPSAPTMNAIPPLTNNAVQFLTGSAEAGSTVVVYDSDGTTVLGSGATVGSTWSITTTALSQGSHSITAKAVDGAGNASAAGMAQSITVDSIAPTVSITSNVSVVGSPATITMTFSESPGATFSEADLTVLGGTLSGFLGAGPIYTAVFTPFPSAGATGSISIGPGSYADAAGNTGAGAALVFAIDTVAPSAPSAPVLAAGSDNGASPSDNITSIARPTFTGTAEADATITLYDTNGTTVLGTTTAGGSGVWSITSSTLSLGTHTVTATATDAAGNHSAAGVGLTVTIESPAPLPPVIDPVPTVIMTPFPNGGFLVVGDSLPNLINLPNSIPTLLAANTVVGGAGDDTIIGGSAGDSLQGNTGRDSIIAGTGSDVIHGGQDEDFLQGGAGDDLTFGDKGADTIHGGKGADTIQGGEDNDVVFGDLGDDVVMGGRGDDVLFGGIGDDYLSGDLGSNTLTGGAGADVFHSVGLGHDVVTDFNRAEGDRVVLEAGTRYTVTRVGADVHIGFTAGGEMVLQGVQLTSLTGAWIVG